MKSTRKIISVILAVLMLITCVSVSFTVNASTGTLCSEYYATNPQGKVGTQKTITIDGKFDDWSSDMLIAQGAAWDIANHYKGGHENCVLDTYALFASWDNDNLYVAWQMVNTTDTWARSGDGPLSDGGRVLDVPLILALDVDPSSTSMSNKNTDGNPIWGQKMGLEFDQHVDRLFYMSGKPGLGTPAMFTAVDAKGNTNYTTGCKIFSSNGIEYKMAEGNVCDSIYGLNYSEDTADVYDSAADWIDYKTFKGSSGAHDTKYDSFYEMKIPFSTLGVDANYIKNNGIGAMLVATRGESGLDCVPFDDTMLDNALDSYSSDASTSAEKDDVDVITSSFARIGKTSGGEPATQPTTAKPTQPATEEPDVPTEAPVNHLTVNAKSNLFATASATSNLSAKKVTVTYDLKSTMKVVNGQWNLKYDASKLRLSSANVLMPNVTDGVINTQSGVVKGNFSNIINLYDFTTSKTLVQATFDIIGTGNTDVILDVEELSVGYQSGGSFNYKNAVVGSIKQNLVGTPGFTSSSITGSSKVAFDVQPTVAPTTVKPTQPATTVPVATSLKVNATSNILSPVSAVFSEKDSTVTVSYKLKSTMKLANSQWCLTYDSTKLSYNPQKNKQGVMPNIASCISNTDLRNKIKGNFSNLSLYDFTTEKDFVNVTFDIIGKGETEINLDVEILGVGYKDDNFNTIIAYPVDFSTFNDISNISGFENQKLSGKIMLNAPSSTDILYGDVNGDGKISIIDATIVQKYAADLETLTAEQKLRGDVDFDGDVDIQDATLIAKYAAELISSFK